MTGQQTRARPGPAGAGGAASTPTAAQARILRRIEQMHIGATVERQLGRREQVVTAWDNATGRSVTGTVASCVANGWAGVSHARDDSGNGSVVRISREGVAALDSTVGRRRRTSEAQR